MAVLDGFQVVASGVQQAHERRNAHVALCKRFHAGHRGACDRCASSQFILR